MFDVIRYCKNLINSLKFSEKDGNLVFYYINKKKRIKIILQRKRNNEKRSKFVFFFNVSFSVRNK